METPFREVAGHAANIGLRLILLAGLAGTLLGQGTSFCGKYSTILTATGPTCQRVGILPRLIVIPGQWETKLRLGVGGDTVRFSFFSSLSLMSNHINFAVEDNEFGSTFFEGLSALDDRPVYLVRYATGIRNRSARANVQCTIGGVGVSVDYAGPAGSGIPGLDQVNVRLTSPLKGLGVSNLMVMVDGIPSNAVSVDIR